MLESWCTFFVTSPELTLTEMYRSVRAPQAPEATTPKH